MKNRIRQWAKVLVTAMVTMVLLAAPVFAEKVPENRTLHAGKGGAIAICAVVMLLAWWLNDRKKKK